MASAFYNIVRKKIAEHEDCATHLLQFGIQSPAILDRPAQQEISLLSEPQTTLPLNEQLDPQRLLQCLDLVAEGRLTHVQLFCRPGNVQFLSHNGKIVQGAQFYGKFSLCRLYFILGQFTRNYTQTVKRAADNKRRYAPGKGHSACLLWGYPKGATPHLAHDFAKQSVVCYTLCRRCRENAVAAGEGKGI